MAITTTKVLRLNFSTVSGRSFTITLNNPREDLTKADIEAVMDTVLEKNIFMTSGGELIRKQDVKIIDTPMSDL